MYYIILLIVIAVITGIVAFGTTAQQKRQISEYERILQSIEKYDGNVIRKRKSK